MLIAGPLSGGREKVTTRVRFQQLDRSQRSQIRPRFRLGSQRYPCRSTCRMSKRCPGPRPDLAPETLDPALFTGLRHLSQQFYAGARLTLNTRESKVRALQLT